MITMLRNHAQSWIIKVVLGIIILTFVISFGVGQFTASKQVLVEIGSSEILVQQFNKEYQKELDQLRNRFPDSADELAEQLNLREQVYTKIVNRRLILRAAEEEGMLVTDDEVTDTITSQTVFYVANRFDFPTYQKILSQNRLTPEGYESQIRADLTVDKYQRNILAGLVLSKEEIQQRYRIENEQVEIEFFQLNPEKFLGKVSSSEKEEKEYYEGHQGEFTQQDQFKVKFFLLSLGDIEPNVKIPQRAVTRYYERNLEEEFTTPKEVKASHILKKLSKEASKEDTAKATALMEEVLKQARKGKDFGQLAKKYSEDMSKEKGGDLGFFKYEDMVPEFSEAAFSMKSGEISEITRTAFGLHIIKVYQIKPVVEKSLDEARPEIEPKLRNQRAERSLDLEVGRLSDRIEKEGLEEVAKTWKLTVTTSDWFDGSQTLKQLGPSRSLYLQLNSRKEGYAGVLRRNPVQGHVFFQVLEKKDSFVKPLEEVRKSVSDKVKKGKSVEEALKKAREGYKKIKAYADFKAITKTFGIKIKTTKFSAVDRSIPGVGFNKEFQQTAFRLSQEKPFGLSIQGKTAYLLFLKNREIKEADKSEEIKKSLEEQLETAWGDYFFKKEIERLKTETTIKLISPEIVSSQ